jgi:molybdopterin-binding protein
MPLAVINARNPFRGTVVHIQDGQVAPEVEIEAPDGRAR